MIRHSPLAAALFERTRSLLRRGGQAGGWRLRAARDRSSRNQRFALFVPVLDLRRWRHDHRVCSDLDWGSRPSTSNWAPWPRRTAARGFRRPPAGRWSSAPRSTASPPAPPSPASTWRSMPAPEWRVSLLPRSVVRRRPSAVVVETEYRGGALVATSAHRRRETPSSVRPLWIRLIRQQRARRAE